MTKELLQSEKVHLVAYDQIEKERIISLLKGAEIPTTNVDFKIYKMTNMDKIIKSLINEFSTTFIISSQDPSKTRKTS